MSGTTDKIENYMGQQRARLGSNLQELEDKVKSAADWQTHFREHPMIALGVAMGGGALLAAVVTRPTTKVRVAERSVVDRPSPHRAELHSFWNRLTSAGIAMAAERVVRYVDDVIPGFKDQVGKIASKG